MNLNCCEIVVEGRECMIIWWFRETELQLVILVLLLSKFQIYCLLLHILKNLCSVGFLIWKREEWIYWGDPYWIMLINLTWFKLLYTPRTVSKKWKFCAIFCCISNCHKGSTSRFWFGTPPVLHSSKLKKNIDYSLWGKQCGFPKLHFFSYISPLWLLSIFQISQGVYCV